MKELSIEEQIAELQQRIAMLMQGGDQVTAKAGTFQGDMQNAAGLKEGDTQPLEELPYDSYNPPPLQTLKIGSDGCTPDRWDAWGRLMRYEGLPT